MARPTGGSGIISTHPHGRPPSGHSNPAPSGGHSNNKPKSGAPKSKGGGGGGISGAERRANAREAKAKSDANKRLLEQARILGQQIHAMRIALGPKGFKKALNIQLAGVRLNQRQQEKSLLKDYKERVGSLEGTASDNQKAAGAGTFAALSNRGRERANALSEATLQGAGETDMIRAQGASLRNWNANQNEVNRSFYDTLTSVNNSLTDLTVDTRTARINNVREANADRNQLWTEYYGNRSEALTQLGNIQGQRAEVLGLANESVESKKTKKRQKGAGNASAASFRRASLNTGKAWHNPGVKASIRNWEGRNEFVGNQGSTHEATTEIAMKVPEGATLRDWKNE